jgi:hypothetical protein
VAARRRAEDGVLDAGRDVELGQLVAGDAVHGVEIASDEDRVAVGGRRERLDLVVELREEVRVDRAGRPIEGEEVGLGQDRRAPLVPDLGEGAADDDSVSHDGDRAHLAVERLRGVVGRIRGDDG